MNMYLHLINIQLVLFNEHLLKLSIFFSNILTHLNNTTNTLLQLLLHRLANRATNDFYLVTNISISKYTDLHKHCQHYDREIEITNARGDITAMSQSPFRRAVVAWIIA